MYKYKYRHRIYISNKKSHIKLWLKFGDSKTIQLYELLCSRV